MCGRFGLNLDVTHLAEMYHAKLAYSQVFKVPNWNCAPTQHLPILREAEGERVIESSRWGWRRPFSKGPLINARADEILTRTKTFRKALAERRCVVPATHFYEWKKIDAKTKEAYAIAVKGAEVIALAGLWEDEVIPGGEPERCHLVCTIEPNSLMRSIHDRQPLILTSKEAIARWLNPSSTVLEITDLIRTVPSDLLRAYPVPMEVGNVRNNLPALMQPVGADLEVPN